MERRKNHNRFVYRAKSDVYMQCSSSKNNFILGQVIWFCICMHVHASGGEDNNVCKDKKRINLQQEREGGIMMTIMIGLDITCFQTVDQ